MRRTLHPPQMSNRRRRQARAERGQSLVELGITIVLLVTLAMGIIEFGRAFMIANMVTAATRDGARAAAVVSAANRDPTTGQISSASKSAIQTQVVNEVNSIAPSLFTTSNVAVCQSTLDASCPSVGGINTVTVTSTGSVRYIFNLVPGIGNAFNVGRQITFRDEGRP